MRLPYWVVFKAARKYTNAKLRIQKLPPSTVTTILQPAMHFNISF